MNFEKHSDLKESIDIGMTTMPIKIYRMYTLGTTSRECAKSYLGINTWDCPRILMRISNKESINDDWKTDYYVSTISEEEHKKGDKGEPFIIKIICISKFLGHYIEFYNKKYKIPND